MSKAYFLKNVWIYITISYLDLHCLLRSIEKEISSTLPMFFCLEFLSPNQQIKETQKPLDFVPIPQKLEEK